jgi:hypothetical protein
MFMDDETNRASSKRLIAFGAFLVSTLIVLRQEVTTRLTAEVFGLYIAAWVFNYVAPTIMDRFGKPKASNPPSDKQEAP